jgi:putative endonuclease
MTMYTEKYSYVYITASISRVLYTGVTSDVVKRIWEHKNKASVKSFTSRYNADKLVYYECFEDIEAAIEREKYIKGKSRQYKRNLIERENPEWKDLWSEIQD